MPDIEEELVEEVETTPEPPVTESLSAIADAIRSKTGSSVDYLPSEMAGEIDTLSTDTGANGLYKALLTGSNSNIEIISDTEIAEISTSDNSRRVCPICCFDAKELHLPNLNTGTFYNSIFSIGYNMRIIELGLNLSISTASNTNPGFFKFYGGRKPPHLKIIGIASLNSKAAVCFRDIYHIWFTDLKTMGEKSFYDDTYGIYSNTITFDSLTDLGGSNFTGSARNTLNAIIIRTPTMCNLSKPFVSTSDITSGFTKFYVPLLLLNNYKTDTNWMSVANQLYGIDEDAACAINTMFTPSYNGNEVDHWDQVNLQNYSIGAVNSSTGSITPTTDGRLLVRGLNSNNEIKYVVYLTVGDGLDINAV